MQAYHHPALQLPSPAAVITPHFVRAATNFNEQEHEYDNYPIPMPYDEDPTITTTKSGPAKQKNTKTKSKSKKAKDQGQWHPPRSATPTALGESIRQHTHTAVASAGGGGAVKADGKFKGIDSTLVDGGDSGSPTKKGSKLVIKNTREQRYSKNEKRAIEEDITRESIQTGLEGRY